MDFPGSAEIEPDPKTKTNFWSLKWNDTCYFTNDFNFDFFTLYIIWDSLGTYILIQTENSNTAYSQSGRVGMVEGTPIKWTNIITFPDKTFLSSNFVMQVRKHRK